MRLLKYLLFALIILFPGLSLASTAPDGTLEVGIYVEDGGLVRVRQEIDYNSASTLSWAIASKYRDLTLSNSAGQIEPILTKTGDTTEITTQERSSSWILEYLTTDSLIRHNDRDQIYIKIFQEPGGSFEHVVVNFFFADNLVPDGLSTNLYAIGGVSEVKTAGGSAATASYVLETAGPNSILTFSASWAKDYLPISLIEQIQLDLMNLELLPWLVVGMIFPALGLFALMHLFWKRRAGIKSVTSKRPTPPEAISPMLVGVLVNKKIFEHEIVGTLVDFCQRGYLVIVHKGSDFFLSQRKTFDDGLTDWELTFLEQLFENPSGKINEDNLTDLSKDALYNPKIKQAFDRVYEIIEKRNYFTENPHLTRMRYKLFAVVLYFLSIAGAIWIVVSSLTSALLLPLAGTMVLAWFIIKLSPQLSSYTPEGEKQRQQWLEFRNYLKSSEPFDVNSSTDTTFERFLPFAIVLGVTEDWAARFEKSNRSTVRPDWFISYKDQSKAQFTADITAFAKSISVVIDKMRGPLVS